MKKILIALLLTCCVGAAHAQMKFNYGVKGGFNITTYSYDADDAQVRLGQWGALCRFTFLDGTFAVQPELIYSRQGSRSLDLYRKSYDIPNQDRVKDETFKVKFISQNVQMPIIVKYYLPKLNGINIQVGPQISYRFDYKISALNELGWLGSNEMGKPMNLRGIVHRMNQWTTAMNVGAGYDSESGIGVDFRCGLGMTKLFKNTYTGDDVVFCSKNARDRVWSLAFSYTF